MSCLSGPVGGCRRLESYRSLLISLALSSSPMVSPFPGPVNQSSDRHDLGLHSSDVQHLPSTDVPTGKEIRAAETSSRVHRPPITAGLGNQCCRIRGWLYALIRTPSFTQGSLGSPGAVLWLSCRSRVGQVCLCDRPFLPPPSAAGIAPKKLRAGKLAGSRKGEHLYLCQGWICHFLMELLAGGRVLYFISIVKHLVEIIFGKMLQC